VFSLVPMVRIYTSTAHVSIGKCTSEDNFITMDLMERIARGAARVMFVIFVASVVGVSATLWVSYRMVGLE
jgi:hypothetical protein